MTSPESAIEIEAERKLHIIEWSHLDLWKFYPMALASSWSVRCFLYPMSVVKSRLQLQKQNNVYTGMRHAFGTIVKNEGVGALYRGFWVTLPQISASFVYSTIYEKVRNALTSNTNVSSAPIVSALAGGLASCFTQLIFVPTDIVSQYMMIHNNPSAFTGGTKNNAVIIDYLKSDKLENRLTLGLRVIRAVFKVDGFFGFYRGLLSSCALYAPSSMVFWGAYYNALNFSKYVQRQNMERTGDIQSDPKNLLALQAFSGAFAGVTSAIVTNPLEILRIRVQVHRTNYYETIRILCKHEGVRVFTKGLPPRMISNGIYSCMIMFAYETVKRASVLPEYKNAIVW